MTIGATRSQILAQLAAAETTGTMTSLLSRLCVEETELTGAGVLLAGNNVLIGLLCGSDQISERLGDLQYELGEGPAVEAIRHGRPTLEPDLVHPVLSRWVAFAGPAAHVGARAVFSFPLHIGTARLGTLDLYRDRPGPLTAEQYARALLMAEIVTEAVLAVQAGAPPGALARGLDDGAHFHYVVQQAAGIVAVQLGISVADALVRLRAYSFGNEQSLDSVARDTVDHTLRFDDLTGIGVVTVSSSDPLTIDLAGEFDLSNIDGVDDAFATRACDTDVVVNTAEIGFASVALLNSLVSHAVVLGAASCELALVAPSPLLCRILDITGTRRYFRILGSHPQRPAERHRAAHVAPRRLRSPKGLRTPEEWAALTGEEVNALGRKNPGT